MITLTKQQSCRRNVESSIGFVRYNRVRISFYIQDVLYNIFKEISQNILIPHYIDPHYIELLANYRWMDKEINGYFLHD